MPEEGTGELLEVTPEREQSVTSVSPTVETPGVAVEQEGKAEQGTERYNQLLSKVAPGQVGDDEAAIIMDAKHIGAMTDETSKVQKLLDLATTKGVAHAVKVARSLKDYFALDTMHDTLANKLYEGLLAKGLIEKD